MGLDIRPEIVILEGMRERDSTDVARLIKNVERGIGNNEASLLHLCSFALLNAGLAWFRDGDLQGARNWFMSAGRFKQINWQTHPSHFRLSDVMFSLVARDEMLLGWIGDQENLGFSWEKSNVAAWMFRDYQMILCLRGDLEQVRSRARTFLMKPPVSRKKYVLDQKFFLALADGDTNMMTQALRELSTPKVARFRNRDVGHPDLARLVNTDAAAYACLAWRLGYEISEEFMYVPYEWYSLPGSGLADAIVYPIVRDYDVMQPLPCAIK